MKHLKVYEDFAVNSEDRINEGIVPEYKFPKKSDRGIKTEPSNEAETSKYRPPNNAVKVQKGDTGFELVKKHYNRFMWTWNKYPKNKKKSDITND